MGYGTGRVEDTNGEVVVREGKECEESIELGKKMVDVTDTTVVYTPQIHYRHDRRVYDGRVC